MLRSIGKQSAESMESVQKKKKKARATVVNTVPNHSCNLTRKTNALSHPSLLLPFL